MPCFARRLQFSTFISTTDSPPYFTLPRLAYLSYQLLLSLSHLNSLSLVHCDIKPENILMESYGGCRCKVIDFGSGCFEGDWKSGYVQSRSYRAPGENGDKNLNINAQHNLLATCFANRTIVLH